MIHPHLGKDYCLNLTEGGGLRAFPGKLHPFYGKHHTNEVKEKIRIARKEQHINGKDSFKGKHHTDDTKEKIKQSNITNPRKYWKDKHLPEYMKIKISETQKGKTPWNKGKKGSQQSAIKGKHKVFDNKELNIFHYEY